MLTDRLQYIIHIVNSKDPMELLEYLINNCGPTLPSIKISTNLIKGCIGKLYISGNLIDGKLYFEVTGESKVNQGMGQLLCHLFNGCTPEEIDKFHFTQLSQLQYTEWLTNSRQNGFKQIFIRIKEISKSHIL